MIYEECSLCPRGCQAQRLSGLKGICGVTDKIMVARAALHFWEEPCISGKEGSGAVFFSGCPLHCIFCQNKDISNGQTGKEISVERLAEIFIELQEKGANNINLVTGTHYIPSIVEAVALSREKGLGIPIVYNTSGYETVESLKLLEGTVDVYLPDFKYMDKELAFKFSHASDYPEVATKAIEEMVRQTGPCSFDEDGFIKRGVIVRNLLMPGHVKDSKAVISYLYETYGDDIFISMMSQYTPVRHFEEFDELNRRVTRREYENLVDYALDLGLENAFIQDRKVAKESFIPDFNQEGV